MKKLMLFVIILLLFMGLSAQNNDWAWAKRAGVTSAFTSADDIAVDAAGNSYICGFFSGTTTFGTSSITSSGAWDVFVAKLDPNGNWLWVKRAGGISTDTGLSIALDTAGNSYICGDYSVSATFGSTTLTNSGGGYTNVFIAKLNPTGNWLWAKRIASETQGSGKAIAVDSSGNCYTSGKFSGTATFGSTVLTTINGDLFVTKLDTNGNWLWAKKAGGTGSDCGQAIAVDAAGNCYVSGKIEGNASFGTINITNSGNTDIFVAKMDTEGNWLWAIGAGGTNIDEGCAITVDANGNSFVSGHISGTATFGATSLTSSGSQDMFVAKLDPNGNWLWAKKAGGTGWDYCYAIDTDTAGNPYLGGYFASTATFGSMRLTSRGSNDIYVAKLDTDGNWLWAKQAGGDIWRYGKGSHCRFSRQLLSLRVFFRHFLV